MENRGVVVTVVLVVAVAIILSNFDDTTGYATQRQGRQMGNYLQPPPDSLGNNPQATYGNDLCPDTSLTEDVEGNGDDEELSIAKQEAYDSCLQAKHTLVNQAPSKCSEKCRKQDPLGLVCDGYAAHVFAVDDCNLATVSCKQDPTPWWTFGGIWRCVEEASIQFTCDCYRIPVPKIY